MDENLDAQVLQLLNGRRGDWQAVAKAAAVSYSWLSKFANGHIDNPGYATLKRLHVELTRDQAAKPKRTKRAAAQEA